MKNKYNLYQFIRFPSKKMRNMAHKKYFDIYLLRYSLDKYNENNKQNENIRIEGFEDIVNFDKIIQNDFREIIRKINNQLISCDMAILRMFSYHEKLKSNSVKLDGDKFEIVEILYRQECVNLSFEIFNIIEKMKTILRIIYSLDLNKTRRNEDFFKILKHLSATNNNLKKFLQLSDELCGMKAYQQINNLRDAQVHNEPIIFETTYVIKVQGGYEATLTNPRYKITNEELYKNIKRVLEKLVEIKQEIQTIIDLYKYNKGENYE